MSSDKKAAMNNVLYLCALLSFMPLLSHSPSYVCTTGRIAIMCTSVLWPLIAIVRRRLSCGITNEWIISKHLLDTSTRMHTPKLSTEINIFRHMNTFPINQVGSQFSPTQKGEYVT